MSDSAHPSRVDGIDRSGTPRAVVHDRIVDEAASRPTASVADIATEVSGASVPLVESVLEESGDPAPESDPATSVERRESTESEGSGPDRPTRPDDGTGVTADSDDDSTERPAGTPAAVTPKQRETLRAIQADTTATQGELATKLGVSRAAICQRLGGVDGFEWTDRAAFVSQLFEDDDHLEAKSTGGTLDEGLQVIDQRLERLEDVLDTGRDSRRGATNDPRHVQKLLHACLHSDRITEQEELVIIEKVVLESDTTV